MRRAAGAPSSRFCHLCGRELMGQFFVYDGDLVCCAACQRTRPRCARCSRPLDDAAIAQNRATPGAPALCARCQREAKRCGGCGQPIVDQQWYSLEELLEYTGERHFCPSCWQRRPRCDVCRAPVGSSPVTLDDGQFRCALCAASMVRDELSARGVFGEAIEGVARLAGGRLRVLPRLAVISRREMGEVRRRLGEPAAAIAAETGGSLHVLGLYVRTGDRATIYAERALPRDLLLGTLAHELGHAWQADHAPYVRDPELCEGFAEWAAHGVLVARGLLGMAARLTRRDDAYGRGLRRYLAAERAGGRAAALALARGQGR